MDLWLLRQGIGAAGRGEMKIEVKNKNISKIKLKPCNQCQREVSGTVESEVERLCVEVSWRTCVHFIHKIVSFSYVNIVHEVST